MFRKLSAVLVAAVAAPAIGWAQVAAPSLVPAVSTVALTQAGRTVDASFTTVNPSVMQWSSKSVFGLNQIQASVTPVGQATQDYGGYGAGLLWHKDQFSVGLEQVSLQSQTTGIGYQQEVTSGALAGALGSNLVLGVSADQDKIDGGGGNLDRTSRLTLGTSLKFGEVLYLGLGTGNEHYETTSGGVTTPYDRQHVNYGLAYYQGSGTRLHLEYYVIAKEDFPTGGGNGFGGYTNTSLVAEMIYSSFLAGYTDVTYTRRSASGYAQGSRLDLGWVPDGGLALTVRQEHYTDHNATQPTDETTTTSFNVSYRF